MVGNQSRADERSYPRVAADMSCMTQTTLDSITDRIDITSLPPGVLLSESELSAIIGVPAPTLRGFRQPGRGKGPNYRRLGGAIRYRVSDVIEWLDDSLVAG